MKWSCMKYFFILSLVFVVGCASSVSNETKTYKLEAGRCQEGTTRTGYATPTVLGDLPCTLNTQTCISGNWQGPQLFESCTSQFKTCGGISHGTIQSGYQSPNSPKGMACVPATKTCLNGTWSGPEVFTSCSELP